MTPNQALTIVDKTLAGIQVSRADHQTLQTAINVLDQAISPKPPEVPSIPKSNRKGSPKT